MLFRSFGAMYTAFQYGVPPHGGFAFGFDRLLMIIRDENNIREIAPPRCHPLSELAACVQHTLAASFKRYASSLRHGGVRVPGGLRRLQSG